MPAHPRLTQPSYGVLAGLQQLCITDMRAHAFVGKLAHNSRQSPLSIWPNAGAMSNRTDDEELKGKETHSRDFSGKMDLV